MKTPKEIVRLIEESEIITNPVVDDRILQDARYELSKRQQDGTAPGGVLWRTLMKTKKTAFVAASMIVIVSLIVFQFVGNPFRTRLTFANTIEHILNANTATYDIVYRASDGSTSVTHYMVMGSLHRRTEANGDTTIMDIDNGRFLILENKIAIYINAEEIPSAQNFLEDLKNHILILKDDPEFTVKELGRKQLDGKEVVGFFASGPMIDITIWADFDTKLPISIETNGGQSRQVLENMKFDIPLEEDLFSMEVPAGYIELGPITWNDFSKMRTEAEFIDGLRSIAEIYKDGYFPDGVSWDSFTKWIPEIAKRLEEVNLPKEEIEARILKIFDDFRFIPFFRPEEDWTYRGKGVRLGETGTPIFWYRPEGSETYRVIYGDLHVENISPENLPQ